MRHFNYNVAKIRTEDGKDWQGIPALHGKNLYETAVEYGFEGTEDDWFNMLITDGWISVYQNFKAEFDKFVEETYGKFVEQVYGSFVQTILSRTINGHAFDKDITLNSNDVGAANKTLTNVALNDFITIAKAAGFETSGGVDTTQTVFNSDGSITETLSTGVAKTTVFNPDGSITENYTMANGEQVQKVITFNSDGSISETITDIENTTEE